MDNEDGEGPNRPGTSRGEPSDRKPSGRPKESSRLNNNVPDGRNANECCADCDTAPDRDHMVAASLVYCDQEDNDSDDDCCIYTYRGDRLDPVADSLPVANRSVSPLMDYLEMDFDPESTVGNESEDEDLIAPDRTNSYNEPLDQVPTPSSSGVNIADTNEQKEQAISKNSELIGTNQSNPELKVVDSNSSSVQNGCKEEHNRCVRRNSDTTEICHKLKRIRLDDKSWIKEMVWSEKHAAQLQVNQTDVSASGATAVVNTLLALRIPFNIDHINRTIGTRLRDETASLIPYLESRSVAGCTAQDIVRTLETSTDSLVSARFFATRPYLDTPIAPWLASWIKKGAVPILTLNHQQTVQPTSNSLVPDGWHHQMMHGIAYDPLKPELAQIYLTNPLCQLSMETLRPQLLSSSTLMIRRNDVMFRWSPYTNLMPLATYPNQQWQRFNVLGQVVNIIRERQEDIQYTQHIVIPTNYESGITLAMKTTSNYCHELKSVPDL